MFEVATGNQLADTVPRVNGATAGGSVAWNRDATGFWYTRYPREGERPAADLNFYQQVYFHRLGTATAQDEYAAGKQFPRIAEVVLRSSDDGKYVLARVANGDGGEFLHYMLLPDGQWHQITRFADHTSEAAFGPDGTLYLLSRKDAPMGKVLALAPPVFSVANAKTILTATRSSIDDFVQAGSHLYVRYLAGGPSKLVRCGVRQARQTHRNPADFLGGATGGAGRQPASVRERKLRRTFGLVSLRPRERADQKNGDVPDRARGFQRHRSHPPDGGVERTARAYP